jgi:hypothetical protein
MQLEISVEQLRKRKLFVATPMYGGSCNGMYMKSCLDLQGIMQQYGIECRFSFIFNESLITRARNYLVDEFLRSSMTHLLFLDADIHFDPRDVVAMLAMDKDVIGAPYPKKSIKWASVIEAVKRNIKAREAAIAAGAAEADIPKEITPGEVEKVTGDYVFNAVAGTGQFSVGEPLEVMELGTGFMMVKREVFPLFEAQYPELKYKPDHVGQPNFDGSRYIHAYFDTLIDRVSARPEAPGESERYLSEDYMFCQLWRKMGGKIHLCPWMKTHHVGTYAFHGDMTAVAAYVGAL